ncbi:MAG: putative glycosyltransferase [Candidatus Scalindua rubra]|uniref:Putative glycosyltransferase n=1 Tax=Candidatus Scalindua rubra TaxID=1872076 RepID=A0A1E3XC86_9BACT|nr:MAG: putative glycosyltransferase [Candidatus Scalindua rubra]
MIKDRDFIVFSDDWGRHPFSCQHIMKYFLPDNRIIWVNTIGIRRPTLTLYDISRGIGKLNSWISPHNGNIQENLTIMSPFMIPYNNIRFVRNFNRISVMRNVRNEMKKLSFKVPILITTLPNASDYIGAFDEILDVYYCVDEFSEWPGVEKELVKEMDDELTRKVDLMIVTSDALYRTKRCNKYNAFLLPHGVDYEHFKMCNLNKVNNVDVMENIKTPIIGYYGLFDERVDLEILEHILKVHPEWSIVIIGKVIIDIKSLKKYHNLYLLGSVSYENLPSYVSYFDVCILPYKVNNLTKNINPLKLREYIATGKPIVSSALPEAEKYSHVVYIASGKEAFLNTIEFALTDEGNVIERQMAVIGESRNRKAEEMSGYIEASLELKGIKCEIL